MQNNQAAKPSQHGKTRKPYQKPQVEQVKLAVDEAVMGTGCKADGTAGPHNGSCVDNFTPCLIEGS